MKIILWVDKSHVKVYHRWKISHRWRKTQWEDSFITCDLSAPKNMLWRAKGGSALWPSTCSHSVVYLIELESLILKKELQDHFRAPCSVCPWMPPLSRPACRAQTVGHGCFPSSWMVIACGKIRFPVWAIASPHVISSVPPWVETWEVGHHLY